MISDMCEDANKENAPPINAAQVSSNFQLFLTEDFEASPGAGVLISTSAYKVTLYFHL